jgi:hypothetical protein
MAWCLVNHRIVPHGVVLSLKNRGNLTYWTEPKQQAVARLYSHNVATEIQMARAWYRQTGAWQASIYRPFDPLTSIQRPHLTRISLPSPLTKSKHWFGKEMVVVWGHHPSHQDSNPGLPRWEAGMITTTPRRFGLWNKEQTHTQRERGRKEQRNKSKKERNTPVKERYSSRSCERAKFFMSCSSRF